MAPADRWPREPRKWLERTRWRPVLAFRLQPWIGGARSPCAGPAARREAEGCLTAGATAPGNWEGPFLWARGRRWRRPGLGRPGVGHCCRPRAGWDWFRCRETSARPGERRWSPAGALRTRDGILPRVWQGEC